MPTDLGKLVRVDPRDVWKHEAHDFTPWLAENIAMLGELLGMDLEVVAREHAVGDFSLDILAKDLGRDRLVAVENQLEATDHSHLGQLITYAAGVEAGVAIWVSRDFREEHRRALDWLNRGVAEREFFGVALELLQIDGSKPAVNLRLVASPHGWSRAASGGAGEATGDASSKQIAYRAYFQQLIDELREKHKFTNAKAGQPSNWYSFSSGTAGFQYSTRFAQGGKVCVELYIDVHDADRNEAALDALAAHKDEIEKAIGEPLTWEQLDMKRACRIACYAPGSIEDAADQLERHRQWAIDRLLKFKKVFGPRLAALAST